MDKPKVLILWNDTIPHKGSVKSAFWAEKLAADGFEVERENSTDPLYDPERLRSYSLIVISWSEGALAPGQIGFLTKVIAYDGVGLAGYHEMTTAFNDRGWHFLIGAYMVAHPGLSWKHEQHDYMVHITKPDDPIMKGISDFEMKSTEQFYILHDGDNLKEVLADTKMACSDYPWIVGTSSPVAYKRRFGSGRIFYSSLGHFMRDFENENAYKIMHRGMLWACKTLPEGLAAD